MKTMFKSISLCVVLTAAVFSSCDEADSPDPIKESNVQLSKIYIDNELAAEFIYNDKNKVKRINYPGDDNDYVVYEYATNGNLIKETWNDDQKVSNTHIYEYNTENLIIKVTTTRTNDDEEYQQFSYNPDKTLKEINVTSGSGLNTLNDKETFTYNGAKNIVGTTWSSTSQGHFSSSKEVITYDNKKNPFFNLLPYQYFHNFIAPQLLSPNNVTEVKGTDGSGDNYVQTFTYKYNDKGYPTEFEFNEEGDIEIWKLEYR